VTTRYERMKMQRRMQRRIRLVVEERRISRADRVVEPAYDPEATMEIPAARLRAIGTVKVQPQ
jgi:hypothetical protein